MEEQCGFKVTPLSLEDFYDLYMLRMYIDKLALDLAIEHGDTAWEAAVVASWHQFSKYTDPKTNKKIDTNVWRSMQKELLITINKVVRPGYLKFQTCYLIKRHVIAPYV